MGCINQPVQPRRVNKSRENTSNNKPNYPSFIDQPHPIPEHPQKKTNAQNQISLGITNNDPQNNRPRIQVLENIPETSQQISETISQLERRRYTNNLNPEDEQNQIEFQQPIEINYQISQLDLLFIMFRALRNQNMDQRDNMILFLRLMDLLAAEPEAQGLSQAEINNLQRKIAPDSSDTCAVCQDIIEVNDQTLVLSCRHVYHPNCIIPWLEKSNKCPVCRHTLSND